MLGSQMLHEGKALRTWCISKSQSRCITPINCHHAFQATGDWRKLFSPRNIPRDKFVATGDLQLMTGDGSKQSLSRLLANFGGLWKRNLNFLRRS